MMMPGRWFEDFIVGDIIEHDARVRITKRDNEAFCSLTHNDQPLHLDVRAARAAGFRDVLVNGLYTFAVGVGMTVPETTQGTLVANLGYVDVKHPLPVYPGDTLAVRTQVVDGRVSSKPGRGIVTLRHTVTNQDDDIVCEATRTVMVLARTATS
jgi:acyl dehydratase